MMKLHFDASQQYQLDAITSVVDIFKGQSSEETAFERSLPLTESQLDLEDLCIANKFTLPMGTVIQNVHEIQNRHNLPKSPIESYFIPGTIGCPDINPPQEALAQWPHFSIEMETGTGKTYVYLRTIHELHKQYGFKKFIIVVPSIAIKEGVIKTLQITQEHFSSLYDKPEMDYYVYDPKKRGQLKNFAIANSLQILVMNIDAFAVSHEKKSARIMYQESDWGIPIEFIQKTSPIVILDEPQEMESEIRKGAIVNLNPLCTMRYSATHRNPYNLMYKLDPVKAYDLGLVKKIEVDSCILAGTSSGAFLKVFSISSKKNTITAKVRINVLTKDGIKEKDFTVKVGVDLYDLSNQLDMYRDGHIVDGMDVSDQTLTLSNGTCITAGKEQAGVQEELMQFQVQRAVENHLRKERQLQPKGIKPLTLFFIDKVANYRTYQDGNISKGKIALWFEEAYQKYTSQSQYQGLIPFTVEEVHNGYFSADKQGKAKDTRGNTKDDDDTYALIMRDKERLLSPETPLRFIFTHSALREGWDNPNVFQICTLNESSSTLKKRQEIGRGLRLPVDKHGQRVFDPTTNVLTVVANESYEDFARKLQIEIEEDCGVNFAGKTKDAKKRVEIKLTKQFQSEVFLDIWNRIKHRTRFQVQIDIETLIEQVTARLHIDPTPTLTLQNRTGRITMSPEAGVTTLAVREGKSAMVKYQYKTFGVPDCLSMLAARTRLSKSTLFRIIKKADIASAILANPNAFTERCASVIEEELQAMIIDGIKYEKLETGNQTVDCWSMELFKDAEITSYIGPELVALKDSGKSLYDYIPVDSSVESQFARDLESREDVKLFFKLPFWFVIDTPLGTYNPDWAVVLQDSTRVYFVAETKSETQLKDHTQRLRPLEQNKIECGKKHFASMQDVQFKVVSDACELTPYGH